MPYLTVLYRTPLYCTARYSTVRYWSVYLPITITIVAERDRMAKSLSGSWSAISSHRANCLEGEAGSVRHGPSANRDSWTSRALTQAGSHFQ